MTGKIISHYETLEHLEDHEFGSVYEARDLESGARVGVLLLPLDLRESVRQRLETDLTLLSRLEHPNLVLPVDHGTTSLGQMFVCFENDRSALSLAEQLRRGAAVAPQTAGEIARQVAFGLAALHRLGLHHGLLRPAFLIRTASGPCRILFPGLGRAIGWEDVRGRLKTQPSRALAYRAPEQFGDQPPGPQSDVWALGGILYEMLTRRSPFHGVSAGDLIKAIVEQPLPACWEGVARESPFTEILDRALTRDLGTRFASAAELETALGRAQLQLDERGASAEAGEVDLTTAGRALVGRTISHFEVVEKIGGGGMGEVFLARDLKLDRLVALKFLSHRLDSSADEVQRFIQEAKAASALDHPNICTIHDIDEAADGSMFIAMAFYEGEMLNAKIERGALDLPQIVDLGVQLCSGLKAAHERGIIHRDIKPANIMVTRDGVVKILDFGLSKYHQSDPSMTAETVMGTVDYMSPEQAIGKEVTQQSDIWSLGIVLFEMATGKRPFRGGSQLSILFDIVHHEPRGLEETSVLGIPYGLARIIRQALHKDTDKRYRDVSEVKQALEALRQPRPPAAFVRRRRLAALFGALLLTVLMMFTLGPAQEVLAPAPLPPQVRIWRGGEEDALNGLRSAALEEVVAYLLRDRGVDVEILRLGQEGSPDPAHEASVDGERRVADLHVDLETRGEEWRFAIRIGDQELPPSEEWLTGIPGRVLQQAEAVAERLTSEIGLEVAVADQPLEGDVGSLRLRPLDPELTQILDSARQALRRHDGARALELLEEAIEMRPHEPRPLIYLEKAEAHRLLGQKEERAAAAERAQILSEGLPLPERLYIYGRYIEGQGQGDLSKRASAAIFAALWQGGEGHPYDHPDPEIRLDHRLHFAESLGRAGQNALAAEFLTGLAELFPDEPRIPLLEGEIASLPEVKLEHLAHARDLAVRANAPMVEARVLMREGTTLSARRRFEEAEDRFARALQRYEEVGHRYGEANALTLRGNLRWDQQRLSDALADWRRAKAHFEILSDELMIGRVLTNMAMVLEEEGNLKGALDTFRSGIAISEAWGDRFNMALNLANMSPSLIASGDLAAAEASLDEAEELLGPNSESLDAVAQVDAMRGHLALAEGDLRGAREYLTASLNVATESEDERLISRAHIFFGQLMHYEGSLDQAIEQYKKSLGKYLSAGILTAYSDRALMGWGDVLLSQGRLEEAEDKYFEAMNIRTSREHQDSGVVLGEIKTALATIALERKEFSAAERLAKEGLGLLRDQDAVLVASRALDLLARIDLALDEVQRATDHVRVGLELLANIDSPVYRRPLEITEIRVLASRDPSTARDAAARLTAQELTRDFFPEWYLESRLLVEETRGSEVTEFRCRRLEEIKVDAERSGFGLIANRAKRMMSICDS